MFNIWNAINPEYSTYRVNTYNGLVVPNNALGISSAYRNPERNERVSGALTSQHLTGNALDLNFSGTLAIPSKERGILFGTLWTMTDSSAEISAVAKYWQLEIGSKKQIISTTDNDDNGVPDVFEKIEHLHIQDNPE